MRRATRITRWLLFGAAGVCALLAVLLPAPLERKPASLAHTIPLLLEDSEDTFAVDIIPPDDVSHFFGNPFTLVVVVHYRSGVMSIEEGVLNTASFTPFDSVGKVKESHAVINDAISEVRYKFELVALGSDIVPGFYYQIAPLKLIFADKNTGEEHTEDIGMPSLAVAAYYPLGADVDGMYFSIPLETNVSGISLRPYAGELSHDITLKRILLATAAASFVMGELSVAIFALVFSMRKYSKQRRVRPALEILCERLTVLTESQEYMEMDSRGQLFALQRLALALASYCGISTVDFWKDGGISADWVELRQTLELHYKKEAPDSEAARRAVLLLRKLMNMSLANSSASIKERAGRLGRRVRGGRL